MEQFNCRSLVNRKNIREVIRELAKQELCQKPHLMASCWPSIFAPIQSKLPGSKTLRKLYRDLEPTCKKLVAIFNSKPENEAERECLHYLKKYIKSLDKPMLKHLLELLTGSQFLIPDEIKVSFAKNDSTFTRKPIAHTCAPCLELPSKRREEFTSKRRIYFYFEKIDLGNGHSLTLIFGVNFLYFTYI